jgi:transcriptional regulator with XRE-family HTH domain
MPRKKTKSPPKPDPEMGIVGQRFCRAREELGLSQIELAKLIGGEQGGVSRFEKGQRGLSTPVFIRLLQLFALRGVDLQRCLIGTGKISRDVVLGSDEPELLRELQEVVRRHVGNGSNGRNTSDKVERPGKRRNKR